LSEEGDSNRPYSFSSEAITGRGRWVDGQYGEALLLGEHEEFADIFPLS
jgi:hypothetical protein